MAGAGEGAAAASVTSPAWAEFESPESVTMESEPGTEAIHHETLAAAHQARHRGDLEVARAAFGRVAEFARNDGHPVLARAAATGLGEVAIQEGDLERAMRYFRSARDTCRQVTCLALGGDPAGAVTLGEAEIGRADRADHAFLARMHAALIMPYTQIGAFGRVNAAAKQALALSSRLDDAPLSAYVHRAVTHAFIEQRRYGEAIRHADEALRLSEELGMVTDAGLSRLARACALMEEDRLIESAAELTQAIEIFTATRAGIYRDRSAAVLAGVRLRQGLGAQALELALGLADRTDPWTDGYLHRVAGMASDDPAEAEAHLRRSAELFAEQGGQVDLVESCRELGRLLTAQGRLVEAVEVYDFGLRGARTVAHT